MYKDSSSPFTGDESPTYKQITEQMQSLSFQGQSTFLQASPFNSGASVSKNTLWMGELEPWMDEGVVRQIWSSLGYKVTVKVINNRSTGQNAGYCFVDFVNPLEAQAVLSSLQGATIPGTRKLFRLNWALGGNQVGETVEPIPEYSIFVGDLADGVDDASLLSLFRARYQSARAAKVVLDAGTGRPRGYGFVRFGNESDRARSLVEMPGTLFQGRPIRVSLATPRSKTGSSAAPEPANVPSADSGMGIGYVDTSITTVFVGNLASDATEEDLRNYFQAFGEIDHIKIPPGKGCGFVQFSQRHQAERALVQLNGVQIGSNRVRLSWGRLPPDRSAQQKSRMMMQLQQQHQEAMYQFQFGGAPGLSPFTLSGMGRGFALDPQVSLDRSGWLGRSESMPLFSSAMGHSPTYASPYVPTTTSGEHHSDTNTPFSSSS